MSLDSSLYIAALPAGTYTAGVPVPLACVKGPAVVRDGYGTPIMKRVITFASTLQGGVIGKIEIQNSNWIDSMKNFISAAGGNGAYTVFSAIGPNVQRCGDVELQPNSSFNVVFVPDETVTTTNPFDVYCLIDIDYPSVAAVANPKQEKGTPVTMGLDVALNTTSNVGTALDWTIVNVDIFKAGFKYLISNVVIGATANGSNQFGFIAINGAAGQAGLCQIIPCVVRPLGAIRLDYDYSNVFVKGPMNIEFAVVDANSAAAPETVYLEMDCIRR